jgi:hypothetical protein
MPSIDHHARRALLAAALSAVDHGFCVFPVRRGEKKPPALHGDTTDRPCPRTGICRDGHQGWEQRATRDPDEVRWYWCSERFAGCNVGIATGPSRLLVVDLDTPKSPSDVAPGGWSRRGCRDGHDVFAAVCADAGHPVPWDTRRIRTARAGTHLYFRAPTGPAAPRLRITEGEQGNGLGWKVDTRAWGGYVIAPGSTTKDGTYQVDADLTMLDTPGWLVHRLAVRPPTAITAPRQIAVDGLDPYVQAAHRGRVQAPRHGPTRARQGTVHQRPDPGPTCRRRGPPLGSSRRRVVRHRTSLDRHHLRVHREGNPPRHHQRHPRRRTTPPPPRHTTGAGGMTRPLRVITTNRASSAAPSTDDGNDGATKYEVNEENEVTKQVRGCPPLHPAALHGPVGEAVRRIHPATEAHPAGVLVQILALLGGMVGDGPHVVIGGSQHPARIWPLLIGPTGKGRKGEALAQARNFVSSFSSFTSYFVGECVASGLSSGEGVVAHFADPADPKHTGRDRRLVVIEKEFARTLAASKREANTLGPILRTLWEEDSAQVMTRTEPLRATGVHLVVIGHISPRELKLRLSEADVSGGTVNRFLPIHVRQWQLLADPPAAPDLADLAADVEPRIEMAHIGGPARFERTPAAADYWTQVYRALADTEEDGPVGEVLARAPAYVLRLALLYALIDGHGAIDTAHIRAGLAVVKYAIDTARDVFGGLTGITDLDKLTAALRTAGPAGLTREQVSALFGRNRSADKLDALVDALVEKGAAHSHTTQPDKGRPTTTLTWNHNDLPDPVVGLLTQEP